MKKSFLMYSDLCSVFNDLTDEQAGQLIKEIVNTENYLTQDNPEKPNGLSGLMKAVYNPFEAHLIRDFRAWENKSKLNKANGKKGGRPKKIENNETQNNPKEPNGYFDNPEKGDKVKDKVKDKDKDNEERRTIADVIKFYRDNISSENSKVMEQASFTQLSLLNADIAKIYLGLINFANANLNYSYTLPNFLKNKIYLDYQVVKEQVIKNKILVPKDLIGKKFYDDGKEIEFKKDGYLKIIDDWLVTDIEAVKTMISKHRKFEKEENPRSLDMTQFKPNYNFGGAK
jgi:hypothetical protein